MTDNLNPLYYRSNQLQIIELIRDLPFSLGNAIKYIYRCRNKNNKVQDLQKALWYVKDHKNNGTNLTIKNTADLIGVNSDDMKALFADNDDFEKETIAKIYGDFVENGDYQTAVELIEQELRRLEQ